MGRKPGKQQITKSEARILQLLAERGPSSVKTLHEWIQPTHDVAYTTILKTVQLMFEKGLLTREAEGRGHIYSISAEAENSKRSWIAQIIQDVFRGSPSNLLLHAVDPKTINESDLAELERTIQKLRSDKDNAERNPE